MVLWEPPEIRREVHARPADTSSINDRALRLGFFIRRLAERIRLKLRMIRELVMPQDTNFVVTNIRFRQIRALLEHNDANAARRKFLCHDSTRRASYYER